MSLIDNYSYLTFCHIEHILDKIIADASFISTIDVVVEQLWKYSAIQINMKSDMKAARNVDKS